MAAVETPGCEFGAAAPAFSLPATDGEIYDFERCRGMRGTLVMFLSNHCPFVKASLPRILRDVGELKAEGIGAVAIMSNDTAAYPEDSFARMQTLARELEFPFPYLLDETQDVARAYGAVCTPDFFGFNAAGLLQYRGRLDAGRTSPPPEGAPRELFDAMRLIARSGRGPEAQYPSIGCSIKWRARASG